MAEPREPASETQDQDSRAASLVARFCAGEAAATQEIEAWVRRAAGPFRQPLGGEWDDAVQESLLKLWAALRQGRFGGEGSLAAYVRRVVSNVCVDRLRSRRVWRWVDVSELQLPAPCRSALEQLARKESVHLLLDVLEEMPAECRSLWQMILDGLSYREMSRRLGVAEGTLRVRVRRCRQRAGEARRRLAERGPGAPA